MRKAPLLVLTGMLLAGCQPDVPNSGAGAGFGTYEDYLHQRESELKGAGVQTGATPADGGYGTSGYGATPVTSAAGIAAAQGTTGTDAAATGGSGSIGADTLAALRATAPAGDSAPAETVAPVVAATGSVGAPLNAMSPAAMPAGGGAGPNLAAYALAAKNAPGQSVWPRGGLRLSSSDKACKKYLSPDLAQMAFLQRGGPQKDPLNLDPDGDGFACGWDPRPFQAARQ